MEVNLLLRDDLYLLQCSDNFKEQAYHTLLDLAPFSTFTSWDYKPKRNIPCVVDAVANAHVCLERQRELNGQAINVEASD